MNIAKLHWSQCADGLRFRVTDAAGRALPFDSWGQQAVKTEAGPGCVGHLVALVEGDQARLTADGSVEVDNPHIAQMDEIQVGQLGIPHPAPYRLNIRGDGILSSPEFRFRYHLADHGGRPILGWKRQGTILTAGSRQYTLLDPLYSLLEGIDEFNALPPDAVEPRFLRWAELKALLPEDAVVDDYLRTMNVVRADSFTLDFDDSGVFHPLLLARPRGQPGEFDEEADHYGKAVLPSAPHAEFIRRFRSFSEAKRRYVAGQNWYVVVPEPLRKALEVVRRVQEAPLATRQAFLANPQESLREALQGELGEADIEVLFEETPAFLSERVLRLGEWNPKLCAYVLPSRQPWLPPEAVPLGVPVGDRLVQITSREIPALIEKINQAIVEGHDSVTHGDQSVPANEESLASLRRVVDARGSVNQPNTDGQRDKVSAPRTTPGSVPILIDNLEELGYSAKPRETRGEPGRLPVLLGNARLYEHQEKGLRWLQEHWAKGSPGALLADDMGLGKTLQVLCFLAWVQEQMDGGLHPRKPFLIVAPTGLLRNWEDEAATHLSHPGLGALFRAYGPDLATLSGLSHRERLQRLQAADWVLTTYETLRDKIRHFLGVDWAVAAFDEAQKIKNPAVRMTEMAKSVQADFFLPLTGTPVENRLADLWSIVDLALPGFLGSLKEFHNRYERNVEENPEILGDLKLKLEEKIKPPVMIRRMKADHLKGLPQKQERVLRVPMPPEQAVVYSDIVAQAALAQGERGAMLKILHGLRQVSLLAQPLGPEGLSDAVVGTSARLSAMVQVLDRIAAEGAKALVFIEFLRIQEALIPYLQQRYGLPSPPLFISGEVAGQMRKRRVDAFQSQEKGRFDVMLLSPKAGGVGLTLTAANHVIHLSRWWNPAVEDQCTDRVLRIGQTKPVHVYLPMAIHPQYGDYSFDVNLHRLLERKRMLSRTALAPPTAGERDMRELFHSSTTTPGQ